MNVVHIVAGELSGGAARGAYWLHQGLLELGVDSRVLTTSRETYGDPTVTTLAGDKKGKLGVFVRRQVDANLQALYRGRQGVIFSTGLVGRDFTRSKAF